MAHRNPLKKTGAHTPSKLKLVHPRHAAGGAAALIPEHPNLERLRQAAANCQACDLWKKGTQTVFGEGRQTAKVMFVGEVPGDREDIAGRPFVGPAGQLLDRALEAAGIERDDVSVTNAVKHFNWVPDQRGKGRIHKKPRASEIAACRPWLDAELAQVKPQVRGLPGCYRRASTAGKRLPCEPEPGRNAPFEGCTLRDGHGSSIFLYLLRLPENADRVAFCRRPANHVPLLRR